MSERLDDLNFRLSKQDIPSEASDSTDVEAALPMPDFVTEDELIDDGQESAEAAGSAEAAVIPDEDSHEDDKLLQSLGKESVRAHYNFINIAVLTVLIMACSLTLLLIRQGERYGEDNAQLTFGSFLDGSYTQQLSDKYIGDSKLQAVAKRLGEISEYFYGFSLDSEKNETVSKPSDESGITVTTTSTYTISTTATTTTTTTMSHNPDVTGTPIEVEPQGSDTGSGDIFTGNVITTTPSLTTSFTTTMSYSHTASKTEGTTTTPKSETTTTTTTTTTTASQTSPSESDTTPEQSDSQTAPTESTTSVTTTPVSSEETPEVTTAPTETQASGEAS